MQDKRPVEALNLFYRRGYAKQFNYCKWFCCAILLAASVLVMGALVQRSGSDISIHATWAGEGDFLQPRTFLRHGAHPLWHVLVALFMLPGISAKTAAVWVTAGLKVLEFLLMRRLMEAYLKNRFSANAISGAALCCALVTSLWVPWVNPTVYAGIGSPNTWHSPTQMIAMVMMLLCVSHTAYCAAKLQEMDANVPGAGLPAKDILVPALLLLVSLVAKPTFMQAFLPAAGVYFLAQWLRKKISCRMLGQMLLAALPSILFMGAQYLFYFSGIIVPSQGSMVLDLSWDKLGQTLVATLLIQAFPLYTLLTCCRGKAWRDPLVALAVLLDAVGAMEYLLLGESGRRAADGNFGWAMMGGALMLWVVMMIYFLRAYGVYRGLERLSEKEGSKPVPTANAKRKSQGPQTRALSKWKFAGGFALLGWHLLSGLYYMYYLVVTTNKVL